ACWPLAYHATSLIRKMRSRVLRPRACPPEEKFRGSMEVRDPRGVVQALDETPHVTRRAYTADVRSSCGRILSCQHRRRSRSRTPRYSPCSPPRIPWHPIADPLSSKMLPANSPACPRLTTAPCTG